jgi:hypothetical protein
MTIRAGTETITGAEVREEREMVERTPGQLDLEDRPVRRLVLTEGLTAAQLSALVENDWDVDGTVHRGFNQLLRHEAVFAGSDPEIIAQERLQEVAALLPDDLALQVVDIYPDWMPGQVVGVGQRLRHEGGLYRVVQAHTAQEHQPPGVVTAALYTRVMAPGTVEAWVPGSYARGVEVAHKSGIWLSGVDNNVWEPGAPGVYDNIWKQSAGGN